MSAKASQRARALPVLALAALLVGSLAGWMLSEPEPRNPDPAATAPGGQAATTAWPESEATVPAVAPAWQAAQLPSADSPDRFQRLQALADQGNAHAAFEMAQLLRDCPFHGSLSNERIDELAAGNAARVVERIERERSQLETELGTDLAAPRPDGVMIAESRIEALRERRDACKGVDPPEHHDDWLLAMERAALLGHPQAQLAYASTALFRPADVAEVARRKPLVRQFLSAALQRGEPDALLAWSRMQQHGYFGEPDMALGFAYLLAWTRHPGHPLHERMVMAAALAGSPVGQHLSPEEIRHAQALAGVILERCCADP